MESSLPLSDRVPANLTSRSSLASGCPFSRWRSATGTSCNACDPMVGEQHVRPRLPHSDYRGVRLLGDARQMASDRQPSFAWGVPVLLGGLLLLTIGRAGSLGALQELSLLPVLFGVALLIGGLALARALALPILSHCC